ncbi:type 1 glutamine amidotransferase domain-containing protein [Exiguobacterium sp. s130]|uniref:type 1 glutamine amidotransferase domain-containing protein n=2 Tax=unclassified Exiguobacterium TaxID=2644629 RepID=UPI001BE954D1|nr:type 1 glutamine amidotransferase domain-containing protein [Exiguobacterium sp. s130]
MARILIVSTSADDMNGHKTGLWFEEFAAPYNLFKDAGHDVTVTSIKGGDVPIDKASIVKEILPKFQDARRALHDTKALSEVDPASFDAVYFPGGHGAVVDFPNNPQVAGAIEAVIKKDGVVASVCHGPAAFAHVIIDGKPFVSGRQINGFTDEEEKSTGLEDKVPFLLETTLRGEGATFLTSDAGKEFAVIDGNVVTGQNPASSEAVAKLVLAKLATQA